MFSEGRRFTSYSMEWLRVAAYETNRATAINSLNPQPIRSNPPSLVSIGPFVSYTAGLLLLSSHETVLSTQRRQQPYTQCPS